MSLRKIIPVVAMLGIAACLWAADNPFIGSWKLNLAKSKITRGQPPKSRTIRYEPFGADGLQSTMITVDAQGKSGEEDYSAKFDGKEYEITGVDPRQILLKRTDDHTVQVSYKRQGKVTATSRFVVSQDGKTLTITTEGTSPEGNQTYTGDIRVYDKQ